MLTPMYEALDSFLDVDTWHTLHPLDRDRFFQALDQIVKHPDFSISKMMEYMSCKVRLEKLPEDHQYNERVERCIDMATTIRWYLEATHQVR